MVLAMSYAKVLPAALILCIILCMVPAAAGEESVTELRIEDVLSDVAPGSFLRFSFSVDISTGMLSASRNKKVSCFLCNGIRYCMAV